MEISIDAARARVRKLEADLALERSRCNCNCDEKRALERELRGAREQLGKIEADALARLATA
jgi:hypothetical protein